MGVLACCRKDCENIVCERYSHEFGYLCDECFDELVNSGPITDIRHFIETERPSSTVHLEANARYSQVFIDRYKYNND